MYEFKLKTAQDIGMSNFNTYKFYLIFDKLTYLNCVLFLKTI